MLVRAPGAAAVVAVRALGEHGAVDGAAGELLGLGHLGLCERAAGRHEAAERARVGDPVSLLLVPAGERYGAVLAHNDSDGAGHKAHAEAVDREPNLGDAVLYALVWAAHGVACHGSRSSQISIARAGAAGRLNRSASCGMRSSARPDSSGCATGAAVSPSRSRNAVRAWASFASVTVSISPTAVSPAFTMRR